MQINVLIIRINSWQDFESQTVCQLRDNETGILLAKLVFSFISYQHEMTSHIWSARPLRTHGTWWRLTTDNWLHSGAGVCEERRGTREAMTSNTWRRTEAEWGAMKAACALPTLDASLPYGSTLVSWLKLPQWDWRRGQHEHIMTVPGTRWNGTPHAAPNGWSFSLKQELKSMEFWPHTVPISNSNNRFWTFKLHNESNASFSLGTVCHSYTAAIFTALILNWWKKN